MFSQASVKNSVHRGRCTPSKADITPWADTPPRQKPPRQTPLWVDILQVDTSWADTPLDRHPPPRRPLQQTVCIVLKYIVVLYSNCALHFGFLVPNHAVSDFFCSRRSLQHRKVPINSRIILVV